MYIYTYACIGVQWSSWMLLVFLALQQIECYKYHTRPDHLDPIRTMLCCKGVFVARGM